MNDVSKIILDSSEQKTFNKFRHRDKVVLDPKEFGLLAREHLIKDLVDGQSTNFITPRHRGVCEISDTGKKLRAYQRQKRKDLWIKNARIPILVSLVTNLSISGIQWLLPLILK